MTVSLETVMTNLSNERRAEIQRGAQEIVAINRALNLTPERSFELPLTETLIERSDAPRARFPLIDEMFVERGSIADWHLLEHLHYKSEKLPLGPIFWKLTLRGETIGVLVMAQPKGMLKERHLAFPKIKPGQDTKITNTYRYNYINDNTRVVSRFVVDTMYRGIGAGYRMMNLVARLDGHPLIEIQSSMSKFNYFGQKAGFRFVRPMNSNNYTVGLKFFRMNFESSPQDFEAIVAEINSKPPHVREALIQASRDFYYRFSAQEKTGKGREKGAERVAAMGAREVIKAVQQITLASPMYGVYLAPDVSSNNLPSRLPLTQFDKQAPNERLKL